MTELRITECRVRPCVQADEKLRAFATITFNNAFVVCDLKVINGNDGIFVAMPSRRRKDGTFRDIAHPLNAGMREYIERTVLAEYMRELARVGEKPPSAPAHVRLDEEDFAVMRPTLYRPHELSVMANMGNENGRSPETGRGARHDDRLDAPVRTTVAPPDRNTGEFHADLLEE